MQSTRGVELQPPLLVRHSLISRQPPRYPSPVKPAGQGPQRKLPGVLTQETGGSLEQGWRGWEHSSISVLQAGEEPLVVQPSSHRQVKGWAALGVSTHRPWPHISWLEPELQEFVLCLQWSP